MPWDGPFSQLWSQVWDIPRMKLGKGQSVNCVTQRRQHCCSLWQRPPEDEAVCRRRNGKHFACGGCTKLPALTWAAGTPMLGSSVPSQPDPIFPPIYAVFSVSP